MNAYVKAAGIAAAMALSAPAAAQAPSWSKEQSAVWGVVTQSWRDEVAMNGRWPGEYIHDRVVAWDAEWPSPRYKDSMEKWTRFSNQHRKTLEYEISPLAISVVGNTAVVHYTGVNVSQRGTDKPDRDIFAAVETLVRSGNSWKFLSLSGFNLKKDD